MSMVLVNLQKREIVQQWPGFDGLVNVNVPGQWQFEGASAGWVSPDKTYALLAVPQFVAPDGFVAFGQPSYTLADDDTVSESYQTQAAPAPAFVARDLIALLTADDYTAIQAATAQSANLGLLWAALLAQGEAPIDTAADRFKAGWAGLSSALGADRAAALGKELGILA